MSWPGRSTGEPPRELSIRRTWPVPFDPYFHEGLTLALVGWQLCVPPGRDLAEEHVLKLAKYVQNELDSIKTLPRDAVFDAR
jgi:hypothetical protein